MDKAELRYRIVAILETEKGDVTMPVLISDEEADKFLSPLPPVPTSGNPNDLKRMKERMQKASREAEDKLLGAKQNGRHPRPLIDFTIETFVTEKRAAKDVTIVVPRVFGMKYIG